MLAQHVVKIFVEAELGRLASLWAVTARGPGAIVGQVSTGALRAVLQGTSL